MPVKSGDIRMVSEDLRISLQQVEVDYVFHNDADHDIDALVAFPLPVLDGAEFYNEPLRFPIEKSTNFLDFHVSSDGKEIAFDTKIDAVSAYVAQPTDVANTLRRLGVSLDVRRSTGYPCPVRESLRQRLAEQKLLEIDNGTGKTGCFGLWETQIQFVWKQHFGAKNDLHLRQTYRPFVGGGYGGTVGYAMPLESQISSDADHFCFAQSNSASLRTFLDAVKKQPVPPKDSLPQASYHYGEVQYVLSTAKNWKGPIHDFRLTVAVPEPHDFLVTCQPLKAITPTTYGFERRDFVPEADLDFEIFVPDSDAIASKIWK